MKNKDYIMFGGVYTSLKNTGDKIYSWFRRKILGCDSNCTPVYDSMLRQLLDIQESIKEVKAELIYDKEILLKELKKRDLIIKAMIEELPDMLWFKDIDGKYIYANKAIRSGLLFDDNPVGKTDVELAINAKSKFGNENHTFGEVCGDSDSDVKENNYTGKRYVESGKVKGRMLHLEVHKSIVIMDGKPIGVVGSGRDITEYREDLLSKTPDNDIFARNEFINKDK